MFPLWGSTSTALKIAPLLLERFLISMGSSAVLRLPPRPASWNACEGWSNTCHAIQLTFTGTHIQNGPMRRPPLPKTLPLERDSISQPSNPTLYSCRALLSYLTS
jgi:hypothetical protein